MSAISNVKPDGTLIVPPRIEYTSYYISELHWKGEVVIQSDDDETKNKNQDDWEQRNNWTLGNFQILEWRSDRNHLEVEVILPNDENHLLAQSLLIITSQAIQGDVR